MTNHEENLKQILETQKVLANEIQELNNALLIKREQYLKLQGIVEYLAANNIQPTIDQTEEEIEE